MSICFLLIMIVTKMTTETIVLLYSHLAIEMGSQDDSLAFLR